MATQKSIPDAQELIWLGGGGAFDAPPPRKRVKQVAKYEYFFNFRSFNIVDT